MCEIRLLSISNSRNKSNSKEFVVEGGVVDAAPRLDGACTSSHNAPRVQAPSNPFLPTI